MALSQNRRLFTLTTPLGPDAFLMTGFRGREELSRPFSFTLDLVSENTAVAPADLVGQAVGWTVNEPADNPRYFHGFVKKLVTGPQMSRSLRNYQAEVVPWLWFLTRTADCRIFQNKTVPDILKAVFALFGFSAYKESYQGSYPVREYCVQYRETAFDFVSRLMEEYGIFYSFAFAAGSHTLVLADAPAAYADCAQPTAEYRPDSDAMWGVYQWDRAYEYRSGKATHTDYNFITPSTNLLASTATTVSLPGITGYDLYDYPGRYKVGADGTALAKVRIEEVEVGYDTAAGEGRNPSFLPGGKFALTVHPADDGSYVLLAVEHTGTENWVAGTQSGAADYRNSFTCAPAATPFRPARTTPRPAVPGPQPAVVVGPAGEEIYTDQYGRIKVQFFWDRVGQKNETSSCWMRVAEMWAGQNWGMVFTPRIGQEVLVDFLEGDPDQPVVTGRVYNAEQMPPYALPANMTQSGVKTRSTKGGGAADFNELRFEDKKGNEDVYFHAQKDFHRVVEHDDDLQVGHDQTITIKNDRTLTVSEGNEKITISKGNRDRTVSEGNDTLTVSKGDRTVTVSQGNEALTVTQGKRTVSVNGDQALTVKQGNRTITVSQGNDGLTVTQGNHTVDVSAGTSTTKAAQSITLKVGANSVVIDTSGVTIDAQSITLKVGANQIAISQSGIEVKGLTVSVAGTTDTKISGLTTAVDGSAMTKITGGMVMIN
ncbi:MAG: Phage-related baseplate assembly protein [Gemmataceae bacterium]|nr:Phage-related baseplate assembly protein [Gemmataceae bacterium]